MAKPIRVIIKGTGEVGQNAPTVDDLFGQVRDFVDVLQGVEKALADDHTNQIVWRVTDAERQNPISFELTPTGTNPAIYVDARAREIEVAALEGMQALRRGERPPYFNNELVAKARKIHERVTNGLAGTVFQLDDEDPSGTLTIDRDAAAEFERALAAANPTATPYRSIGSVEGFVVRAEHDGFGRAILRIKARLDGSEVKAIATGHAFRQIEAMRLGEVWQGVRVRVFGLVHHKSLGVIDHVDAESIAVMDTVPLPGIDAIVDPNFTGGLTTEEYLAELRDE